MPRTTLDVTTHLVQFGTDKPWSGCRYLDGAFSPSALGVAIRRPPQIGLIRGRCVSDICSFCAIKNFIGVGLVERPTSFRFPENPIKPARPWRRTGKRRVEKAAKRAVGGLRQA